MKNKTGIGTVQELRRLKRHDGEINARSDP